MHSESREIVSGAGTSCAARADAAVELEQPPVDGEQERDRVVGDLFVAVLGHVADGDPEVGRGGEVDVVEPDAVAHDRAAAAQTFEVRAGRAG